MKRQGFTLVEVMIGVLIVGILGSLLARYAFIPLFKIGPEATARQDIRTIGHRIDEVYNECQDHTVGDNCIPTNGLVQLVADIVKTGNKVKFSTTDPWKRPYNYHNNRLDPGGAKKKKGVVINPGQYDLWSNGEDGQTSQELTASASRDDIFFFEGDAWIVRDILARDKVAASFKKPSESFLACEISYMMPVIPPRNDKRKIVGILS